MELLRINPNVVVVIDRDGNSADDALREYKKRVQSEVGADRCWVTQGREIENYLPPSLLKRFLTERFPEMVKPVTFGQDDRIDDSIAAAVPEKSFAYARNKKGYARSICNLMTAEDTDCLNLKEWIKNIRDAIGKWNEG